MNGAAYLTADLGNSALKLVAWRRGEDGLARPVDRARWDVGEDLVDALTGWLSAHPTPIGVAFSSVGGFGLGEEVTERLEAFARDRVLAPPDWGGIDATRQPASVGLDRLFAARGAWECVRGPAVVVDAGTALTVDAMVPDPERDLPRFLGGAIAPGPQLLAEALARGGARLFAFEPEPGAPALGRDSLEAMRAGVSVGFAGAALRLVARVAAEAGLESAPVLVTGGARRFLDLEDFRPRVRELLVHEGLLAAGSEATLGETWRVPRGAP